MSLISVEEIVQGIKDRDDRVLRLIYKKHYKKVQYYVTSNSGNASDAEDLFQDAILVVYKNIQKPDFKLTSELGTYLISISRLLWLKELKRRKREQGEELITDKADDSLNIEDQIAQVEEFNILRKHLGSMPKDCREVLTLFFQKHSLKEIAEQLGFSSVMYVKKKKYKCKEKLVARIKADKNFSAY